MKRLALFPLILFAVGCGDGKPASHYKIEMYNGGKVVKTWYSRCRPDPSYGRFDFYDEDTGVSVTATGDISVTIVPIESK